MANDVKIGAYICKGCGLGDRLDAGQLETIASREGKAGVVKQHDFLCNADGVKTIQADIDAGEVNRVVICACSRRAKTEAFTFDNVTISRANLREGVIWVRPDDDESRETTQEMASDYVRMACAEAKYMTLPEPNPEAAVNRNVLIVGGGITGLTAAVEVSKAGYSAIVVEKSANLGGWAAKLYQRIPDRYPFADPQDTGIAGLIAAVEADSNITVHVNSTITTIVGAPGRFLADISEESGSTTNANFGSIIQASGFTLFDANQLPEFGFGKSPDVMDQGGFEALAKAANGSAIKRPSDGKEVKDVVFVQCAGQRSDKEGHLPYCSGHCCASSIKQAMYVKNADPDANAVILFTDLRTPGAGGEDFYRAGQEKGVTFSKGVVSEVASGGGGLTVKFKDRILDEDVNMHADLVVLATGMVPNSGVNIELVAPVAEDEEGEQKKTEEEKKEEEAKLNAEIMEKSVLRLDYRQGPDVPQLVHGFTDSHFICFPYETRRTGIYTAGPVRRPMDMGQAMEDATGAALKAIQSLENAGIGRAAHPRSGDLSFPSFRKEGCTQCKRCTVECPFGAINEDEKRYPLFNESRCRRCGTCMGACPVRVISFENYSVDTVGQQIKAVDIPEEFDEKPRILVLACENDAYPALDTAAMNGVQYSAFVRIVPVRCLGSVNTIWITDALNGGYDGIMLMGCQKGDNYQCHFVKGSEMAHYRMSKIDDTLQQLQLETERVVTYEVAITDVERAPQLINDMAETIERIGLSPFKF
uniref:Putative adenylylsulfate reductase-associated electron transfer protein QmoB n=1 Tax=Candidatus Kentrum sp. TUN TaxID=2126343 RepID=A0A450ZCG7_9GAMM|nr:MAG: putative adenylylsulfate reductase-associated electron transfer protein QmoB [Candidatus Kentron sp. TUN]VFK51348.1 MAG: putative adenylylsulfate reductase-associated electron transfer protein QmoB [Candidatus Kentron sp. TUN]VFK54475.1 MAG: putative adenylylsulfate reductase-associated electron transfer protein QmoB [Candidatus Kentron sp. TUN]